MGVETRIKVLKGEPSYCLYKISTVPAVGPHFLICVELLGSAAVHIS